MSMMMPPLKDEGFIAPPAPSSPVDESWQTAPDGTKYRVNEEGLVVIEQVLSPEASESFLSGMKQGV